MTMARIADLIGKAVVEGLDWQDWSVLPKLAPMASGPGLRLWGPLVQNIGVAARALEPVTWADVLIAVAVITIGVGAMALAARMNGSGLRWLMGAQRRQGRSVAIDACL
jgi:hypothetical protein